MTNIIIPFDGHHRVRWLLKILLNRKRQTLSVFIILIFFSIMVAGGFLAAFIWSVRSGQYDDDYTPSVRMLFDDKPSSDNKSSINQNSKDAT
jgi:cbb3-type cytochrome oxidase maturation protein